MNASAKLIPWEGLVKFHKEICRRAEETFFSLPAGDADSERWTSLDAYEPAGLAGPWIVDIGAVTSKQFLSRLKAEASLEVLLGGPSWFAWKKPNGMDWFLDWRPMLYREVRVDIDAGHLVITPQVGSWDISPLVFELLEKRQLALSAPLEAVLPQVIENVQRLQAAGMSATQAVIETLSAHSTELGDELRKARDQFPAQKVRHVPSPWVLFSPPRSGSTSAYTQHILKDYTLLEQALAANPSEVGGLELLTNATVTSTVVTRDVLPIVPLNPSQLNAVEAIFKARPVTVISGPPGCGKSQVVLSLMLNAWSQGVSVLFASNNNQAVDIVRQRLETFENEIPIAIRAGAKKFNNIIESLHRSLSIVASTGATNGKQLPELRRKQADLSKKLTSSRAFLDSELPDRVDQAVGAAITAYAYANERKARLAELTADLEAELIAIGYHVPLERFEADVLVPFRGWLGKTHNVSKEISNDQQKHADLKHRAALERQARNQACGQVGLDASAVVTWAWLHTQAQMPNLLEEWWATFKSLVQEPIDADLQPVAWDVQFERWPDASTAEALARAATTLAEDIRTEVERCAERAAAIASLEETTLASTARLQAAAGTSTITGNVKVIDDWLATYATLCSMQSQFFDWLPWSSHAKTHKTLKAYEAALRNVLPISVWKALGSIDEASRTKLSSVLEVVQTWMSCKTRWEASTDDRAKLSNVFDALRKRARECGIVSDDLPVAWARDDWGAVARALGNMGALASSAATAWRKRVKQQRTLARIKASCDSMHSLAAGAPLKEAWLVGHGAPLVAAADDFAGKPSAETLARARAEVYAERPRLLIDSWRLAIDAEARAAAADKEQQSIPTKEARVRAWIKQKPDRVLSCGLRGDELPGGDAHIYQHLQQCENWFSQWQSFRAGAFVDLRRQEQQERVHAFAMLGEALEAVPTSLRSENMTNNVDDLRAAQAVHWDVAQLKKSFEQFSPGRIRANVDRLEAELSRVSFELAKLDWRQRVSGDTQLLDSMRDLRMHYLGSRLQIQPSAYPLFERVLRAQPIWITAALSAYSIPFTAGLFDLLVIDEATQCTLTNLLPLIYRAKRLVVIGDPEQLPAITSIGLGAERGLAEKYQVTNWLSMLGHADNDIYKACVSSLPHRQSDVIMLVEHYRSHPLIIGFSNQYIYRRSLRLRRDPTQSRQVPLGAGVIGVNVPGTCERSNNSWYNSAEVEAIVSQISQIRADPSCAQLTIGVVTPFRRQADAITQRLGKLDLEREVTVDTVHGYQGDERDIMIFGPVVSKGMNPAAAKWVETPRNLINVAITRAREALVFVADFNECRKQQGILGQFTRYVEKVNKLRATSAEELQLFGWILMQGMMPEVHPLIRDMEVDFVLTHGGVRLAIEVDGDQHDVSTAQDTARDAALVGAGYQVLRVKARDVREAPAVVLARIGKALETRDDEWDFEGFEEVQDVVAYPKHCRST